MSRPDAGFRFRPGRYPTLVFLLVFPLLVSLGVWQLNRAEEKAQLQASMMHRADELPLNLNLIRDTPDTDRFRQAQATGRYVGDQQWLQDNRVHAMQSGYHVYSLFELSGSHRAVLVNRGWVPTGRDRSEMPVLPLPAGEVSLAGHLDHPASVGIALGDVDYRAIGLTVLPYLRVHDLGQAIARDLLPLVLVLDEGQPGALTPDPLPVSQMGPDKHLGYAVQWFALALALLMIYVGVNTRRVKEEMSR